MAGESMSKSPAFQVWETCQPNKDILNGSFQVSELALDLYGMARGIAKPPYHDARSFFKATYVALPSTSSFMMFWGRRTEQDHQMKSNHKSDASSENDSVTVRCVEVIRQLGC
jgi:hypothetical protein